MRDYLADCQKIEEMMAEIYRRFAVVDSYSHGTRLVFERLALDEEDHALQLKMAKGIPEDIFFEGPKLDAEEVNDLFRRAQDFLYTADDPPSSELLVLLVAKDLERDFMKVHLQNAVKFKNEYLMELFKGLTREDRRHLETLEERCRKLEP